MFQWDKSIKTLAVPADQVVQLFRSMRDVQLALPGLPAQEASAYLCQHQAGQKTATTVAFHLLKSGQLAFYADVPREADADKAAGMLDQALMFIESMGFLMTDMDIRLLSEADREMLWSSLPLQKGVAPGEEPPAPAAARGGDRAPASSRKSALTVSQEPSASQPPASPLLPSGAEQSAVDTAGDAPGGVDELLAAVEALRTRRTGPRMRRKPPSREEVQRRRRELTANLGRILASL